MYLVYKHVLHCRGSQRTKSFSQTQHMTLEIQVLAWDRHANVMELDWLMGYQPPLDN